MKVICFINLKICFVALEKAALDPQDLRLLSSGPRCGLSEINLPPKVCPGVSGRSALRIWLVVWNMFYFPIYWE